MKKRIRQRILSAVLFLYPIVVLSSWAIGFSADVGTQRTTWSGSSEGPLIDGEPQQKGKSCATGKVLNPNSRTYGDDLSAEEGQELC